MTPDDDLRQVKAIGLVLALSGEGDAPSFGACQQALAAPLDRLAGVDLAPSEQRLVTELRQCCATLSDRARPLARLRVRRALLAAMAPLIARLMTPEDLS